MKYPQLRVRVGNSILNRRNSILSSGTACTKAEVQRACSFSVEVLRGREERVVQAEVEKLSIILSAEKADIGFTLANAVFCLPVKRMDYEIKKESTNTNWKAPWQRKNILCHSVSNQKIRIHSKYLKMRDGKSRAHSLGNPRTNHILSQT